MAVVQSVFLGAVVSLVLADHRHTDWRGTPRPTTLSDLAFCVVTVIALSRSLWRWRKRWHRKA